LDADRVLLNHLVASLHAASRWFESVADRHQHGIAAFSAFGTVLAVIVALYNSVVARRNSEPKLTAHVDITIVSEAPSCVVVHLRNTGYVPITLQVNCFWWCVAFSEDRLGRWPLDLAGDEHIIIKHKYPFELKPTDTDVIFLYRSENDLEKDLSLLIRGRRSRTGITSRRLRPCIVADNGRVFRATMSRPVRDRIRAIKIGKP